MRTLIPSFIVAAGLLAVSVGTAHAQDVKHNYVSGTNFAAFKTYRWIDLPNAEKPDQIVDQQIRTAIDNNLAKKGLTKATGEDADVLVACRRNASGMPTAPVDTGTAAAGGTVAWVGRPRPPAPR
jgi:hypothetical protein